MSFLCLASGSHLGPGTTEQSPSGYWESRRRHFFKRVRDFHDVHKVPPSCPSLGGCDQAPQRTRQLQPAVRLPNSNTHTGGGIHNAGTTEVGICLSRNQTADQRAVLICTARFRYMSRVLGTRALRGPMGHGRHGLEGMAWTLIPSAVVGVTSCSRLNPPEFLFPPL